MTASLRALLGLCVLGLLGLTQGCALFNPIPPKLWEETEVGTPSEQLLREVLLLGLRKSDYPVGKGMDPGERQVVSGWRMSLSPFKGRGWREQATVTWEPRGANRYGIKIRILRESNESLRPLDLRHAKWRRAPDNPENGKIVLQYVRSQFGSDFEVGESAAEEEFR